MDWRIAELQSEIHRLRVEVEAFRRTFERAEDRKRQAAENRTYLAIYLIIYAALLLALAAGFGWI